MHNKGTLCSAPKARVGEAQGGGGGGAPKHRVSQTHGLSKNFALVLLLKCDALPVLQPFGDAAAAVAEREPENSKSVDACMQFPSPRSRDPNHLEQREYATQKT